MSTSPETLDVSVVIATFNCGVLIEETVKTILSQKSVSFELIIVDDGSGCESCRRLEALAQTDERIRLHCLGRNQGPSFARNFGI